jgi:DNA polymerase III subunit epsilon
LKLSGICYNISKEHQIIDTLEIAKILFPNQKNNLDSLNERLGVNIHRPKHRALVDAEITTEIYLSMLK